MTKAPRYTVEGDGQLFLVPLVGKWSPILRSRDQVVRAADVNRLEVALAESELAVVDLQEDLDEWHTTGTSRSLIQRAEQAEAALAISEQARKDLLGELEDWTLVADGVKHDWRCRNNTASGEGKGDWLCLRCQLDEVQRELDALALLRVLRKLQASPREAPPV